MPGDRLPGFYRGTVVDGDDPEGLLRLRVKVPQVLGDAVTDWAWPSIPVAMGVIAPAEGDPVWVTFEGGDIERPIWTGVWRTYRPAGADPDINFGGVVGETTYGLVPSNGTASTIARSDHTHGTPSLTGTPPTTILPDDAVAVGTGTTPARHDHRHAIATTTPGASVRGDTAAEGVSSAFARADHRHDRTADLAATNASVADLTVLHWMTRVTS